LRLSTLGFLQYLSPSLQFVCAVLVIREPFTAAQLVGFVWIWTGLAVFTVDSILARGSASRG
jgi:chloramphenicol-sensitive protein RarD